MKRILTIQDISCVGKCSLTVALPVISALGLETAILPTAVLSTHTGFRNFSFLDLTDEIEKITAVWKKENISFDGIYTGFLGSFRQLNIISRLFDEFKGNSTLILVDPCMGDNGKLYPGFDADFVKAMSEFCKKAEIITPNITEASFMCGLEYKDSGKYDKEYIDKILNTLSKFGAKKIVLKGISYTGDDCGVIAYDTNTKEKTEYFHELLPLKTSGTGDIFASVLFGSLVLGSSIDASIRLAADFVLESIKSTLADKDRTHYGVHFEKHLEKLGTFKISY
ncbi:pyridoxamine kinase [Campylobacter mucosalis]|uniref:pyridoxamine kinase n=1 Tax=Campylobacter mucosalis TaxID=202 RepID=UPI00147066B1|nr:pyridoxamine kinase [Campylobacter mucosalis]